MSRAMTPEAIKALRASVRKWNRIAAGNYYSEGPNNCPLCKLYWAKDCAGCPVRQFTRLAYCAGTPYEVWENLPTGNTNGPGDRQYAASVLAMTVAKTEANFLRALLPRKQP
jgi:hypothetical protein